MWSRRHRLRNLLRRCRVLCRIVTVTAIPSQPVPDASVTLHRSPDSSTELPGQKPGLSCVGPDQIRLDGNRRPERGSRYRHDDREPSLAAAANRRKR
ncbi:hypothetical protein EYF80_013288 [Liparis tanakae]|uniref:Secreted protein n=1 Tax=Liparis tanakae TaxID=230148 RepID=A0A4Z2IGY3_9TELE|nr:hypothetical protein EYF80_013288 [Liparis tanakae]